MKIKLVITHDDRYLIYKFFTFVLPQNIVRKYSGIYKEGRRVGNTTRMIDMFVQDFFNKGECQVYDHHPTQESRERVFKLVLERLNREHGIEEKDVRAYITTGLIRRKFNQ